MTETKSNLRIDHLSKPEGSDRKIAMDKRDKVLIQAEAVSLTSRSTQVGENEKTSMGDDRYKTPDQVSNWPGSIATRGSVGHPPRRAVEVAPENGNFITTIGGELARLGRARKTAVSERADLSFWPDDPNTVIGPPCRPN